MKLSSSLLAEMPSELALSKASRHLLGRFKVGQRITIGFSLALGLAFAGTSIGIIAGNFYQRQAQEVETQVREEIGLLSQLQTGVLQARTHQQQLIPLSEYPEAFEEEYSHIFKHAETIQTVMRSLSEFMGEASIQAYKAEAVEISRIRKFLKVYNGVPERYLEELDALVKEIEPDVFAEPSRAAQAQQKLLTFTNSSVAISFDGISDDLSEIIQDANRQLDESRQAALSAQQLRNRTIVLSMALSSLSAVLLAWLIGRSIAQPLSSMEQTALQVMRSDDFDLQTEVTGSDEVGTVASSFNLLLKRVDSLLTEQRLRSQELLDTNQKLLSTQHQMIAQERLASLGSLTAGIAHEIKNPLNFVNNFSELSVELLEELCDEIKSQKAQLDPASLADITDIIETLKANLNKIERHGKRADKIVANMLMHSRDGKTEWSKVDINALVAEAISLAYHGMRAKQSAFNLEINNDYDDEAGEIWACAQDLNRVFLNIASNACYAIYQKQLTEGEDFSPWLKVRTRSKGECVEICIRDNGTGMSNNVRNKIFDQFFTTKPAGEGTGLGLSLSYGIVVDQHGGSLQVASEEGLYTDFVVTLPKTNSCALKQ